MKLHKKLIITGKMTLLTGLHIGDSKDNVEIGGVDNPVVRRKDNNEPYIPGSSLKGKLRSLLEVALGEGINAKGETNFDYTAYKSERGQQLARLFGSSGDKGGASRLMVRDASLTRGWARRLDESEFTDMPFTEVKFENTIDRIKGTATNPRQTERIPAGAEFEVELVVNIITRTFEVDDKGKKIRDITETEQAVVATQYETQFVALLKDGIQLLEDDYLGGSGSRGYGQVKFDFNNWENVKAEQKGAESGESGEAKNRYQTGITVKTVADYLSHSGLKIEASPT